MAEIVNLRLARKRRDRSAEEARAAQNRAQFGTSKAVRDAERANRAVIERRHDSHRRENGGDAES
ncbi:DUF4169 family protein [Hansschlegelia zhihuaiae]|uniref:DUF4169 family protein n=1 Tax=Hansschlegelia zhihuaiae TaxID=405005 RepID=A0A4Q0MFR4_9HYPH|nr:DUF4169 family protein [Hansschlegelia zhihuaiae]RXF72043.1 DUF4169 family protein [Hansschlegelia zhihuaiae]